MNREERALRKLEKKQKKAQEKLEKSEKKQKDKLNKNINKKKTNKLVSKAPYKAVRIVLWVLIGIILVRGTMNLIRGSEADKIDKQNKEFLQTLSKESGLEAKAFNFAESFTREYFNRYPTNTDYFKNNMMQYTSEQLANDMNNDSYSETVSVSAFSFSQYSENQVNVKVEARIKQYVPKPGQNNVPKDKLVYDTNLVTECIEVPIYIASNGDMSVDDLPIMVSMPKKAQVPESQYTGETETDADTVNKINNSINQFFKAYYELDQTQLNYFLADGSKEITGTNGQFKLNKIDSINIYKLQSNEYLAIVDLTINNYGNDLKQHFNLTLVKQGDKYLIKSLQPRTSNLNVKN